MNKEEYYSRLKKTTSKLLTDRCSYEESHNIALQQIYLKDKYIETLEEENQQLKKQKDDVVEYIKSLHIFSTRSNGKTLFAKILNEILRMLGEIDVED